MALLDRYLVREFAIFFAVVIAAFAVLMTGNTAYVLSELFFERRVPLWVASQILLLRVPAMLVLGFPVATLFAVFLTMGRLARDSELIALRTGGVAFGRLVLPVLGSAAIVSLGSFWLNEVIVPNANHESQNLLRRLYLTDVVERAKSQIFFRLPGDLVLYTTGVDAAESGLDEVMLFELDRTNKGFPDVTLAREGTLGARELLLTQGSKFEFDDFGAVRWTTSFGSSANDVTRELGQLFGTQRTVQEGAAATIRQDLDDLEGRLFDLKAMRTDYYFKFAIPLANLTFALVGLVFVAGSSRSDPGAGLLIGLGCVVAYWVVMGLSRQMGHLGVLEPVVAAWLPNAAFAGTGVVALALARK